MTSLSKARISYSYSFKLVNHIVKQLSESVVSEIEAGYSCKSLHVGPILWQQGISSIPRFALGVLFCSEGPGFNPPPWQTS